MRSPIRPELAREWLGAAGRPEVAASVDGVHAMIEEAVRARGPACWASGRCCNFRDAGHELWTTGLEAALTVRRAGRALRVEDVERAVGLGGCPFQSGNLCGEHAARPVGCRVYFCDRSAQGWQAELAEEAQRRIRAVHDAHGVGYVYAEWGALLAALAGAGA